MCLSFTVPLPIDRRAQKADEWAAIWDCKDRGTEETGTEWPHRTSIAALDRSPSPVPGERNRLLPRLNQG